jgi:hypothetical protein
MAQKRFDGLVEVVRYLPTGQIDLVRVYERRGPTYSDLILLDRKTLLERLKARKKYTTGQRISLLGSSFETKDPLVIVNSANGEFITAGSSAVDRDDLKGTPLF